MDNFDIGIIYCDHQDQDILTLRVKDVIAYMLPRCLECGQVQSEGDGHWRPLALFVLYFLYEGEIESARKTMDLMDEGRARLNIPYPIHTEEEYKIQLEKMRPELDRIKKSKLN